MMVGAKGAGAARAASAGENLRSEGWQLPGYLLRPVQAWAHRVMASRAPDFVIGEAERPYMLRWWAIPRNRFFNIYLHRVLRSDDDRALHDHPWLNATIMIGGAYREHCIAAGGINIRRLRTAGSVVFRRSIAAHRLEVIEGGGNRRDDLRHRAAHSRMGLSLRPARLGAVEGVRRQERPRLDRPRLRGA